MSDIQDAVDLQMQPLWPTVNGTAFDSEQALEAKQKRLNELREWANKTEDRAIRKAQLRWIEVAQYTISHERSERDKRASAKKIIPFLPPLPL